MGSFSPMKYLAAHLAMDGVKSGRSTRVLPSLSKNLYSSLEGVVPILLPNTSKNSKVGVWISWYPKEERTWCRRSSTVSFLRYSAP